MACEGTAQALKSDVIRAAHASVAFIHFRVFNQADRGVWAPFKGDLEANVEQLRHNKAPEEPTLLKV